MSFPAALRIKHDDGSEQDIGRAWSTASRLATTVGTPVLSSNRALVEFQGAANYARS